MNYINIKINDVLDFKTTNEPYVIKDHAKDWYAYKNWSFEYIKNLDSNLLVNTIVGDYSGKQEIIPCKLKNYIEKIISNQTTLYLALFQIFKEFPDLKKHIKYQDIKKHSIYYHLLSWIGPKGAITGFHADWSENINTSIRGKKKFYLVSPKYNKCMYPSEKFERATIVSNIDLKNIDEKKFPLFREAELIKVTLEEGDALYIPRGWWHYAESLTPTINVSIHYWRLGNFFRDFLLEVAKIFMHNIGFYKKYKCACHTFNDKGERLIRSSLIRKKSV